MQEENHKDFI